MTGRDYFDCASACVLSRPVPTADDRTGSTNFDCVIEYSHFRLASARGVCVGRGRLGVCGSAVVPPLWRLGGFGAVMFGNTAELGGQGFQ